MVNEHSSDAARFEVSRPDDATIAVALGGTWTVRGHLPALAEVTTPIDATPAVRRITFDSRDLGEWDTGLLTFILGLIRHAKTKDIAIDPSGLPKGMLGLIDLATAVPAREGTAEKRTRRSFLRILGDATLDFASGTGRLMAFIGEAAMSLFRFATGRARFRRSDMWLFIEQAGVDALPIVSLLSLLQGLTMAIAVLVLGLTPEQFLNQLFSTVPLSVFITGLTKSAVFGLLVALSGCMQGINCGRSAAAVGDATTSAVVMAIVAIIVGDGIFGVLAPPFPVGQ